MHYLKRRYSPEQIVGTLALVHAQTSTLQVSHETIYTAIYAMPRGELRTEVIGWLRFGHAKRRPRARGEDRRGRIPGMVSIHDRPPEIDERLVPGHWEGDLIKGRVMPRSWAHWWSAPPCSRCFRAWITAAPRRH